MAEKQSQIKILKGRWFHITGAARREIILFTKMGVAFERCEAGVFFAEMMKRLQQKYVAKPGTGIPRQDTEKGGGYQKSSYG